VDFVLTKKHRARLQAQGHVRVYNGVFHAFRYRPPLFLLSISSLLFFLFLLFSFSHILRKILALEGASGLYRGLLTSLIKMTPAHAVSYMLKEQERGEEREKREKGEKEREHLTIS
jgi:Mitochondrial carrier protein